MDDPLFANMKEHVKHKLIHENYTMENLSIELTKLFPNKTGLSASSLKRFCAKHDIRQRTTTDDEELDKLIAESVSQLGPNVGIRPIHGLLRSRGIHVSQNRVALSLKTINPNASRARKISMGRILNPIPYSADGFGDKYHLDQNEKLIHYGVTTVIMIDGFSRMITGSAVMAIKNNVIIYDKVYRDGVLKYGLCRQIRTDYGKEFELMHYVHKTLLGKESRRTGSKKNMPVERQWVDLNSRVFYPIKESLRRMEAEEEFSIDAPLQKNAVSTVSRMLVEVGLNRYITCHNHQIVQGRGIPVALMTSNNKSEPVGITRIPAVDIALMFAGGEGHNYQQPYVYGVDPLAEDVNLQADRHQQFQVQFNIEEIYNHVVAGHRQTFLSAIMFWQDVTTRLAPAS